MEDYSYMNQDVWWRIENYSQDQYYTDAYNESYHYDPYNNDSYDNGPYDESYDNGWRWADNFSSHQDNGSPCFLYDQDYKSSCVMDDQESDESSYKKKLDKIFDLIENIYKKEENHSKSISAMERNLQQAREQLEEIAENLNHQPSGNLSDTTQEKEVSFLCSDNMYDNKVHKPTPPKLEVVAEDYASLDDKDTERIFKIQEAVIDLESSNEEVHEFKESKVGEGFVEANTTAYPTTLKKPETQLLVVIDSKRPYQCKLPNVIIDHPFLATIHAQISCREGAIDVTFGDHNVGLVLLELTNYSPISGELYVINTIHDYVNEHTANMLSDTTQDLEKPLSCNRSNALDDSGSQQMKRRSWNKKHDNLHSHKSKMKVFYDIKPRLKNFTRRKSAWLFKTRFERSRGRIQSRRFRVHVLKEGIPFDPGETLEHMLVKDKRNDMALYLHSVTQSQVIKKIVGFKKTQLTYDPP